jgi:Cu+-exporting ATPase
MNRRTFARCAVAFLTTAASLRAASPATTLIEVHNMHCAACARKIAGKLYAVPGVVAVRTDVAANTATITPQQQRQPSPKAMWEAVEKAGFKPIKLEGPAGTFSSKPRA